MIDSDALTALAIFPSFAAIAWAAVFAWGKWLRHRHDAPSASVGRSSADEARLAELEAGLEALTLEVERMAEGQRYTVRLLDERLPRPLPAADRPASGSGRVITPH